MTDVKRFAFWIFVIWTFRVFYTQETEEDYNDSESMPLEYYQLEDGKPLNLTGTQHCLEDITALVLSGKTYGNHNKSSYYIKIKWTSRHFMMSIKVESNSLKDSYCEAENKHYYNRKPLNQSVHVFPDDVNEGIRFLPIKLDCKYIITPELEGMCRPIKLEYTTPVCINNETCSCRNVFIPAPEIQVELLKDGVNVVWSFPKNLNETQWRIVISIYQEDGINIKKVAKRKVITKNFNSINGMKHKEYVQVNITSGNNYRIQSYFENRISCHGNSTFLLFRHPETADDVYTRKILPFTITSGFLTFFVLMSFTFLWKKQFKRICLKIFRSETSDVANVEFLTENYNQKSFLLPQMIYNSTYPDQSSDSYWFDYRDLVIVKEIGNGNFGVVYLATTSKNFKGIKEFAVKQIKDKAGPEDLTDFIEEINMFKLVGSHPNVVKMFGYCGSPYPLTIIMEYVPFNLLKYLKNLRIKFEKRKVQMESSISYARLLHCKSCSTLDYDYISQSEVESVPADDPSTVDVVKSTEELDYVLNNRDLEVFGLQIARGMAHLESLQIIHRDLAARNVLMDSFKNLKISDFGMSRTGIYVNKTTRKFPLRWMSPEALINRTYSNKSDVWSFGIVLWEIGTLGAFPYSTLQNEEVIAFLKKGGHLERPENVTAGLYKVMVNCWARLAEDRPTFRELVQELEESCERDHGYVDFGSLHSTYVFPPMEEDVDNKKETRSGGEGGGSDDDFPNLAESTTIFKQF